MALTMPGSAPGQMKTLVPSTSSSIECGGIGGGGLGGGAGPLPAAALASTTTGTKPSAKLKSSSALRRASRRHVKSCCGVIPCCRATADTTASGSSDASTARAFSSSDQRRSATAARDHLNPAAGRGLRVKRKVKSRHKPISNEVGRLPHPGEPRKVGEKHRLQLSRKRAAEAVQPRGLKFQGISASMSLLGQRLAMRSNVSLAQA